MKTHAVAGALSSLLLGAPLARAEEGMWTFNRFPIDRLERALGLKIDEAWLEHVRLASARLAQGCSASFVSPDGLVMTNQHCVNDCVQELSTAKKDLVADGYSAKTQADELRCTNLEVNRLVGMTDVTPRVMKAAEGKSDADANEAKKAEMSRIEKECATSDAVRCDVVTLYNGGVYDLYRYERMQDVRLAFAPELAIAFFGGDPDNFMFPRHDLDVAFVRVYQNDKPAKVEHWFGWSPAGTKEGDVTFVSGHPGSTSRLQTVAELEFWRDTGLLPRLLYLSEMRGMLVEYARRGKEQARHSKGLLFGIENYLKKLKGEAQALFQPALLQAKRITERALRDKVLADKAMGAKFGGAWDTISKAVAKASDIVDRHAMLELAAGFGCDLFDFARTLVRAADEIPKPNDKRLREFSDGRLPALQMALFAKSPVTPELEILRLSFGLSKLREALGPDDALVMEVLGNAAPDQLAARVVKGSKLGDPKVRKQLYESGAAGIAASKDPMIVLAKLVDAPARAVRKRMEDETEAPIKKGHELIAQARFGLEGTSSYPDATFTLRLSYGAVKGWQEGGRTIAPYTTFGSTFDRHTGADPFALPKSWLAKKGELDFATPMNFVTTNDIIGGNSGSPVIDRDKRIVGLIFDGNIHMLGGDYGFDPALNRAVAVDSRAILYALDKVYGATRLVAEIRAASQR